MKLILLFCVLAVAVSAKRDNTRIAELRNKVISSSQQFAYEGFSKAPVGIMSIKVNVGKPQTITLTKEQQKPKWQEARFATPLKKMGYNEWMPLNGGMVFKNEKGAMVECAMGGTTPLDDGKIVLDYKCRPMNKARFAQAKATYWVSGQNTEQDVASGWDTRWGPFDYPFYTVSSQGILGCKNTSGGYCTPQNADLFPFESCYSQINEAGEAKALCEKRKREKEEQLNQLEKEVEQSDKEDDEETAHFFGKNYKDAVVEGMHINEKMEKRQQEKEQEEAK